MNSSNKTIHNTWEVVSMHYFEIVRATMSFARLLLPEETCLAFWGKSRLDKYYYLPRRLHEIITSRVLENYLHLRLNIKILTQGYGSSLNVRAGKPVVLDGFKTSPGIP